MREGALSILVVKLNVPVVSISSESLPMEFTSDLKQVYVLIESVAGGWSLLYKIVYVVFNCWRASLPLLANNWLLLIVFSRPARFRSQHRFCPPSNARVEMLVLFVTVEMEWSSSSVTSR